MTKHCGNLLILISFLVMITVPISFSNKRGGTISDIENRQLAKFPTIIGENNELSNSVRSDFQSWLNDNLFGRLPIAKINGRITYTLFNVSPTNSVHVGEEGWFFYTNDKNLQIAQGTNVPSMEMLEQIKKSQVAIQQALKAQGITYVLVLTPSKASIYPEYIRGGNYKITKTPIDIVSDYLSTNTTIPVINLKQSLLTAKGESQIYHKTDTHWNEVGAYIGYSQVIKNLKEQGFIDSEPTKINTVEGEFKGEFSFMMGNWELIPPESTLTTVVINPKARKNEDQGKIDALKMYAQSNQLYTDYVANYSCSICDLDLLLLGDSFFNTWNIPNLFAENFSTVDYMPTDQVTRELIDLTKPNIVILERTERYLYTLANDPDPYLITEPLNGLKASISISDFQENVARTALQDLDVVVRNTGLSAWTEEQMVKLCVFQNGNDVGLRVHLPTGKVISPGEEVHFSIPAKMLTLNTPSSITIKMVQEGYQYFGDEVELVIND